MCLYTKYLTNRKYQPTKKNDFNPPKLEDERLKYVPIKCGKCYECRKEKKREWLVRLNEEIRHDNKCYFVTLTYNDKSIRELQRKVFGYLIKDMNHEEENAMVKESIKLFLERIRKETGKSRKHWLITEKGEDFGRIHLHGLFWGEKELLEKWQYGYYYTGTYVNEQTINYITKYVLKQPEKDKSFIPKIFASKGIGSKYLERADAQNNAYRKETNEMYTTRKGLKIPLPQYYRYKIYSEEEREKLWIEKQERGYRYVGGEKVSTENLEEWENLTKYYQERGKRIFGDNPEEWDAEKQKRRLERMRVYRIKARKRLKT